MVKTKPSARPGCPAECDNPELFAEVSDIFTRYPLVEVVSVMAAYCEGAATTAATAVRRRDWKAGAKLLDEVGGRIVERSYPVGILDEPTLGSRR